MWAFGFAENGECVLKKSMIVLFTVMFGWFSMVQVAEAKRFGGGSNLGYSKSVPNKSYNTAPKEAPAAAKATSSAAPKAAASGASKWLGPLAGLAAGGLLAAMLFGDGFEGLQIMDLLMFALIAFLLFKLFVSMRARSASQHAYRTAEYAAYEPASQKQDTLRAVHREASAPEAPVYAPHSGESIIGSALGQGVSDQAQRVESMPAWFDAEAFVEGAKGHFVTLQKAWDDLDLNELEAYCTPELYADIQQQMAGRTPGDNQTVVDTLYAEIADQAIEAEQFVVSIRFSGFIQEAPNADAHAFNEIWHIRRSLAGEGNWLVSGIQQGY